MRFERKQKRDETGNSSRFRYISNRGRAVSMVPRAFVDITSAPRACLLGDLMGFLEDLEKASPRAWRSYRNAFESVECARHADYTEERVLLACIEMNEYISGEFTRVPACASIYIYISFYLPTLRYATLAPYRIERRAAYGDVK